MIELMILLLDLSLCFMKYDEVFRSYGCVFHDKNCTSYAMDTRFVPRRVAML